MAATRSAITVSKKEVTKYLIYYKQIKYFKAGDRKWKTGSRSITCADTLLSCLNIAVLSINQSIYLANYARRHKLNNNTKHSVELPD